MSNMKLRRMAAGLAAGTCIGVTAYAALAAGPGDERAGTVQAQAPGTQVDVNRDVRVRAPRTDVDVDKDRGKVRVRAPYTAVNVDPDRGQVRVRAPYVDLDIRW